jgi:hypothetical protein
VGGVQVEDFWLDAVPPGEQDLTGTPVRSTASQNEPERFIDLTWLVGSGPVERIEIIDIEAADGDEAEEPGFEEGWGADIDAVECLSQ